MRVRVLRDVLRSRPPRPDSRDGGPLPLQLLAQLRRLQLDEGVEVVEHDDQGHVHLQCTNSDPLVLIVNGGWCMDDNTC